jgi:hypothetical protein
VSQDQRKRRQFLADALFAGGSLAVAALTARWLTRPAPEPQAHQTPRPDVAKTPEPMPMGAVVAPQEGCSH